MTETDAATAATAATAVDAPVKKGQEVKGNRWARFHRTVNQAADDFYYRLGFWVASNPKKTLAAGTLFVILCCFGLVRFRIETDGERHGIILVLIAHV